MTEVDKYQMQYDGLTNEIKRLKLEEPSSLNTILILENDKKYAKQRLEEARLAVAE